MSKALLQLYRNVLVPGVDGQLGMQAIVFCPSHNARCCPDVDSPLRQHAPANRATHDDVRIPKQLHEQTDLPGDNRPGPRHKRLVNWDEQAMQAGAGNRPRLSDVLAYPQSLLTQSVSCS